MSMPIEHERRQFLWYFLYLCWDRPKNQECPAAFDKIGQKQKSLCKGTKAAIGFHSFGFLIPRFFVRFTRSAGEGLQRFAMMNFWVDPLASSAAISGRCSPCLLLPGPFGRPTGRPKARLVGRSSFICAEINPRSTAAIIVPPKSRSKSSPKTGGRQIDDTYAVSIGYQKSYGRFGTFA